MKTIKDLIKADDPQSSIGLSSETSKESRRDELKRERLMDRLWERLQEIYGHQLNSQYGETIPESWERLLTGLTPEQIKQGLEKLVTRKDSWPPNAVEFRQLCLPETISPDGKNSSAYLEFSSEAHPEHKQYSKTKRIESASTVSKRKDSGNNHLKNLKDLF